MPIPVARSTVEPEKGATPFLTKSRKSYLVVLAVVWLISSVYMATHVKRIWMPHDEGTLGLSAERVLQGQLPHRDFDDYTGGLTFLHALAFRVWGINSGSMRNVLLIFFVAWVPAVFYVAARFSPPVSAGVVTLVALAWSVPNYPAPMPSWYTLFFATWGVAALLRYLESGSRWWIFAAGLCGGFSMLAKVTGAYYVAGVLLFLVFHEQCLAQDSVSERGDKKARAGVYSGLIACGLGIFVILLYRMIHKLPDGGWIFFFVVPPAMLAGFLVAREFAGVPGPLAKRIGNLMGMGLPFLSGVAIPGAIFVFGYWRAGALHSLFGGLVGLPERALKFASLPPLSPMTAAAFAPFLLWIVLAYDSRGTARTIWAAVLAVVCALVAWGGRTKALIWGLGWCSLAASGPVLTGAVLIYLWKKRSSMEPQRQQQLVLLASVSALCSIVQFPFGAPGYFFYAAPLLILATAAFFESIPHPPRLALATLAAFYVVFILTDEVTAVKLGLQNEAYATLRELNLPRAGGLRVESGVAKIYEETIHLVEVHAKGEFAYAVPDCPEIYFLSGLKSPSRHYFEYAEENDSVSGTLRTIERLQVNVIAINRKPSFSPRMSQEMENELAKRFPHSAETEKFTVRWKD
jgi:hypothetical protein